jgi:hypothetical protein
MFHVERDRFEPGLPAMRPTGQRRSVRRSQGRASRSAMARLSLRPSWSLSSTASASVSRSSPASALSRLRPPVPDPAPAAAVPLPVQQPRSPPAVQQAPNARAPVQQRPLPAAPSIAAPDARAPVRQAPNARALRLATPADPCLTVRQPTTGLRAFTRITTTTALSCAAPECAGTAVRRLFLLPFALLEPSR